MKTRATRLFSAALILGVLGTALPASMAHANASARRMALIQAVRGHSPDSDGARLQHADAATDCHTDPRDDTEGVEDAHGDILEWCAYVGDDEIKVSMELLITSIPQHDPNWDGFTAATWGFDIEGDTEPDYLAILALIEDELYFGIADEDAATVCQAREQRVDSVMYEASFAPDCLDGAEEVGVTAVMLYDSSYTSGEDGSLTADMAPNDGQLVLSRHTHGGPAPTPTPTPTTAGPRVTRRVSGATRIVTAIAVSQRAFPGGSRVVYLASQDVGPDALVAGTLTDGPILLVPSCGTLPAEVAEEIRRLAAQEVIALGGPRAVCDQTLAAAAAV